MATDRKEAKPMYAQVLAPPDSAWAKTFSWPLSESTVLTLTLSGAPPSTDDVEMLSQVMDLAKVSIKKLARQRDRDAEVVEVTEEPE